MTRREWIGVAAALGAAAQSPNAGEIPAAIIQRYDTAAGRLLEQQVSDPSSPWLGSVPDQYGLHTAASAGGFINTVGAAYLCPTSRYHESAPVFEALRLASTYLHRCQSPDGNISLETTNFNSPPDTGFVVWGVAEIASAARRLGSPELEQLLQPFLLAAAGGMAKGGVHTPNHRWVVSSALAQIHSLWPNPAYIHRIDQWLGEGIDIDEDGQYTERSTTIYNSVCDRAFTLMAVKLNRPELFDPVRRNLAAMLYLLHPGYEVVTEISRRQDLNQRGNMGRYWYPLAVLSRRDGDGRYAVLAEHFHSEYASLGTLLDQPELLDPLPKPSGIPDDYHREYRSLPLVRIRRGLTSASILLQGSSRFFVLHRGAAVVEAVRFASAFFGKGQFVPQAWERHGDTYVLHQDLEAGYYQPLEPLSRVAAGEWGRIRGRRAVSELCRLRQSVAITEMPDGFRLRIQSSGTSGVPIAVEIGLRDGGELQGCESLPDNAWLLRGAAAVYEVAGSRVKFGPGTASHSYVQVRGAEPRLPATSVYLTGQTPFDHTMEFHLS